MKEHIHQLLEQTVATLCAQGDLPADVVPRIQVDNAKDKAHGDLATNLAMLLAKAAGKNPRLLAQQIIDALPASNRVAKVEIAGPGFINFYLDSQWLARQIDALLTDAHLGVKTATPPQTIVVDYSAPNVAKEMHIGHLRTTAAKVVRPRYSE